MEPDRARDAAAGKAEVEMVKAVAGVREVATQPLEERRPLPIARVQPAGKSFPINRVTPATGSNARIVRSR